MLISEKYTSAIDVNNIAGVVTKAAQNSALLAQCNPPAHQNILKSNEKQQLFHTSIVAS